MHTVAQKTVRMFQVLDKSAYSRIYKLCNLSKIFWGIYQDPIHMFTKYHMILTGIELIGDYLKYLLIQTVFWPSVISLESYIWQVECCLESLWEQYTLSCDYHVTSLDMFQLPDHSLSPYYTIRTILLHNTLKSSLSSKMAILAITLWVKLVYASLLSMKSQYSQENHQGGVLVNFLPLISRQ